MRIVKEPAPPARWSADVTCNGVKDVRDGCGALLNIEEEDLFRVHRGNHGLTRAVAQFQCPLCKARTDFGDYPLPELLPDFENWRFQSGQETDSGARPTEGYTLPPVRYSGRRYLGYGTESYA